jgi:hypothetical protein
MACISSKWRNTPPMQVVPGASNAYSGAVAASPGGSNNYYYGMPPQQPPQSIIAHPLPPPWLVQCTNMGRLECSAGRLSKDDREAYKGTFNLSIGFCGCSTSVLVPM